MVRLCLRRVRRRGRAGAALFVDLVAAFYQVLPELALGPLTSTEARWSLFERLGWGPEAATAFERDLSANGGELRRRT